MGSSKSKENIKNKDLIEPNECPTKTNESTINSPKNNVLKEPSSQNAIGLQSNIKGDFCFGCGSEIKKNESFIKCLQNHFICSSSGCVKSFINNLFENPDVNLPAKCPICYLIFPEETIENQLKNDPEKLEKYYMIYLNRVWDLNNNEVICRCPFCNYLEIRNKEGINFIFCQKETCKKRSCFFCHLECEYDPAEDDESEEKLDLFKHFECAELSSYLEILEKAVERGIKAFCPNCGLSGMKDDGCTHISCSKCGTNFCYLCGLDEKTCDKEGNIGNIYNHNIDWMFNKKRCPMYLIEINDIDINWPINEENSLQKFHCLRTKIFLKKAIEKLGEKFAIVDAKFSFLTKNNLKYEEIMSVKEEYFERLKEEDRALFEDE